MVLSQREKRLIVFLGGLVGLTILYFGISSIIGYGENMSRKIERREALLSRATVLTATLNPSGVRSRRRGSRKGSLIGYAEQLAGQNALKSRIQLNRVPVDKTRGIEAIDIKLDQLSLDEAVGFIHAIENSQPVLVVDQMELNNSFRSKQLLRLSLRVLAQK